MKAVSELPPPSALPSSVRTWRRYPAYRDSGVPWLGKVPEHWSISPLKHVTSFVNRGVGPDYVEDGPIRAVNQACIQWDGLRTENVKYHSPETSVPASRYLRPGDVLMNSTGTGTLGRVVEFMAAGDYIADSHVTIIRTLVDRLAPRYLTYLLSTHIYQGFVYASLVSGSTNQIELSREGLRSTPVLLPPSPEQAEIAAFLDRETAKVDALVAKRERQIALLAEKRAALISRAVTRGLDPNAPLKDSGVPWLGAIPAHWQVKRLKHLADEITVGIVVTPAKYYVDDGVPCLRSLNVRPGWLEASDLVYISPESNALLAKSMLLAGDLVCVRTGQPGTTAVVDGRFDRANCIDLIIIRRSSRYDSHFLAYVANSELAVMQFKQGAEGAIQQHFNVETAKNLIVPVPPIDEQRRLVAVLRARTAEIDALTGKLREHVARLREFRTALIAAAVTGQIDVRGEGA